MKLSDLKEMIREIIDEFNEEKCSKRPSKKKESSVAETMWENTINKAGVVEKMSYHLLKRKGLSVFDKKQIKMALTTITMPDAMANVMGGMTKAEAEKILKKFGIKKP